MAKPGLYFYSGDYQKDTRTLSLAARGAWVDALLYLDGLEPRGKMTLAIDQWARVLSCSPDEAFAALTEIQTMRVGEISPDLQNVTLSRDVTLGHLKITVVSRRMIREEIKRRGDKLRQQKHRKNHPSREDNGPVTDPLPSPSPSLKSLDTLNKNLTLSESHKADSDEPLIESDQTPDQGPKPEIVKPKSKREPKTKRPPTEAGIGIANLLWQKIVDQLPGRTPPNRKNFDEWARQSDHIAIIDKHGYDEQAALIEWLSHDVFWSANILSVPKFRAQWNKLVADRRRRPGLTTVKEKPMLDPIEALKRRQAAGGKS